jgi:uncharacterized membrane protein
MEENKVDSPPSSEAPVEKKSGEEKNTTMAIIAYFIFFVPLLTDSKNDPFVKYHVKQAIALVIIAFANAVINNFVPFWGFISGLVGLGVFVLWIMGVVNAAGGKMQPVPIVGKFAEQYLKF